jgi:hypothetical protein
MNRSCSSLTVPAYIPRRDELEKENRENHKFLDRPEDLKYIAFAETKNPIMPTLPLPTPAPKSPMTEWLRLAANPATVRRAFITALIVGTVLIAINEGPIILAGQVTGRCVLQMCLTVMVPYVVSTVSRVSTRRALAKRNPNARSQ